jgi:hypothetical protein
MTYHDTKTYPEDRVRQGDIFEQVPYIDSYVEFEGKFELVIYDFPYTFVLTQDCDLLQNRNERIKNAEIKKKDKFLFSIIVAPLYNAEHLFSGNHLEFLDIETELINSDNKKKIKQNNNPRYHFINFGDNVALPDAVIDFKHYFSISLNWLESNSHKRICSIMPIYREYISQRFANYLSRIGLPSGIV